LKLKPVQFIVEPIEVDFSTPPLLEKTPGCPDAFTWRSENFQIKEKLNEWQDYRRRGRMARNMAPEHAAAAERRGSWGVGQFYFRVLTSGGRVFDIYYDRAPRDASDRKGSWFLYRELSSSE
jgi:hypothetical protein